MKKQGIDVLNVGREITQFSQEILTDHRHWRTSVWSHVTKAQFGVILTTPVIYACVFPFLLLDLSVSIYQSLCFPVYGVPKVRRQDYLIFDRGHLRYLNLIEKVGCVYCSYANGLIAYVAEIAARTEQRFSPIKHSRRVAKPHSRYAHFLPYGDARAFRKKSETVARSYGDITNGE
jgi:hypothetical protein